MVSLRRSGRRGTSTLGCLFSLLLFAAALYYGVNIGGVYLRYYRLLDAMRFQANLAPNIDDEVISRRLSATADSLLGRTPKFYISRVGRPSRIVIQTEYSEVVDLPLFHHRFVLRPRAEEPL
jgi:hypothetical protein